MGRDVSEGEFGQERVPFPADAFAGKAFVEGQSVGIGPIIGSASIAFQKSVAQGGKGAQILGRQGLHGLRESVTERSVARWCCWIPVACAKA